MHKIVAWRVLEIRFFQQTKSALFRAVGLKEGWGRGFKRIVDRYRKGIETRGRFHISSIYRFKENCETAELERIKEILISERERRSTRRCMYKRRRNISRGRSYNARGIDTRCHEKNKTKKNLFSSKEHSAPEKVPAQFNPHTVGPARYNVGDLENIMKVKFKGILRKRFVCALYQ